MGVIEDVRKVVQDLISPDLKAMQAKLDGLDARLVSVEQYTKERFAVAEKQQAAFEERIDERLTSSEKRADERYTALERRIEDRFVASDKRIEDRFVASDKRIEDRFVASDKRMDDCFAASEKRIDDRFVASEKRIDDRFASVDLKFGFVDARFDSLEKRMDAQFAAAKELTESKFDNLLKTIAANQIMMMHSLDTDARLKRIENEREPSRVRSDAEWQEIVNRLLARQPHISSGVEASRVPDASACVWLTGSGWKT